MIDVVVIEVFENLRFLDGSFFIWNIFPKNGKINERCVAFKECSSVQNHFNNVCLASPSSEKAFLFSKRSAKSTETVRKVLDLVLIEVFEILRFLDGSFLSWNIHPKTGKISERCVAFNECSSV